MQVWGLTHRGAVRQENQDCFSTQILNDGRAVAVVCDGMGGALAGNVASSMAVELFMKQFLNVGSGLDDEERLRSAAAFANEQIFKRSSQDKECIGMGTTLVAVLAGNNRAIVINEGDSRAYHVSQNGITLVTRDHSLVADLVERGELTQEEAKTHPHKNLITRALGAESELMADCYQRIVEPGDYFLLCTDGLSNLVDEQELLYEVIHGGDNSTCCQRLLDIALSRGAPDNVTVVLIQN